MNIWFKELPLLPVVFFWFENQRLDERPRGEITGVTEVRRFSRKFSRVSVEFIYKTTPF